MSIGNYQQVVSDRIIYSEKRLASQLNISVRPANVIPSIAPDQNARQQRLIFCIAAVQCDQPAALLESGSRYLEQLRSLIIIEVMDQAGGYDYLVRRTLLEIGSRYALAIEPSAISEAPLRSIDVLRTQVETLVLHTVWQISQELGCSAADVQDAVARGYTEVLFSEHPPKRTAAKNILHETVNLRPR
jgi:hypothetical protein